MVEIMITTVIPTFKRPALLKRAIESVLAQSYKNLIVCVYDNASGDETEEIVQACAKRDKRVFYFKNRENIGALANMLQGLNAVTTPYYSLLSDDDFLLPGFYENAVKAFESTPDIGFVCSKTIIIDLIDKKLQFRNQNWVPGYYEPSNEIISKMFSAHFVTTGVLMSKKVRDTIGLFDPSGSDILYMTIAATSIPFTVLECYGAAVTLHQGAYSMVGEGIAKECAATLYEMFLSSTTNVMKLGIIPERKVHLLLHIVKLYQQYFDTKKLHYFMNKNNEKGLEDIHLTSLITSRGLVIKFYDLFPTRIYSFLTRHFNLMGYMKRIKHRMLGSGWVKLPNDAYALLDDKNSDVSKLMPYLKQGS